MSGQLDIDGREQPLTWDGEPLYSAETVAEGLFDAGAFEQMRGQMAYELLIDGEPTGIRSDTPLRRRSDGLWEAI